MREEKRIVLFLEKYEPFNKEELTKELEEKFPQLGKAMVRPVSSVVKNLPLIIFNKGIINLAINKRDVSFTYERKDKEAEKLFLEIMSFLEESFSFVRIGYVSSFEHTKKEKENFIENVFLDKKMITGEFQLAWHKNELIDSVKVNVWERHLTDMMRGLEFISIFDINTPIDEKNNINSDFVENFIKKCDKFIRDRINDRF